MNCKNCGAPLELGDSRTILTCNYCQSSTRLEIANDDGDRVVSLELPSGLDCPRCEQQLVKAAIDGQRATFCEECHGILIEAPIFNEVSWNRRIKYRGPELAPTPYDPESFQRFIDCPQCHRQMEVHPHYGPGRAVIDSCPRCSLVWLDNSELTSIEKTPGRRS